VANRLTGVKLGRHERFLLSHAGSSQGITPLLIDPEEPRSTQQGLLRASLKLESAGLIERQPLYKERRVRDPRRERPHFHAGRFWTYSDPRRRHYVRRIAIWRTSFGEAIHQEFLVELRLGRPIRWTDRRVARAEARARRHTPDLVLIDTLLEQQDDRFRDLRLEQEEAREERREYCPRRCAAGRISGAGWLPSGWQGGRSRTSAPSGCCRRPWSSIGLPAPARSCGRGSVPGAGRRSSATTPSGAGGSAGSRNRAGRASPPSGPGGIPPDQRHDRGVDRRRRNPGVPLERPRSRR
jgi:hypothetical protein